MTSALRNWRLDSKWLLPISVLAVAFVADAWKLGQKNLWLDEAASWITARRPLPSLVAETAADVHPPLYYLALKLWMAAFGDSAAALRSLSLVCGVAGVLLAFRLASRFVPIAVAYVAALWYALSPLSVFFSQEARMYPAAGAAVLGACLACRRWIDSEFRDRRALIWYGVSSVTGLYVHYFTVLPLVVIGMHVVLLLRREDRSRGKARRDWMLVHAGIVTAFAPWVPVLVTQVMRGQAWREAIAWSELPHEAGVTLSALTFGTYYRPAILSGIALRIAIVLGVGLGITAVKGAARSEPDAFLTSVGIGTLVLGLALMPLTGYLNLARYLSFCWPLLIIAAARGWNRLRVPALATCSVFLVCILTTGPALQAYYASSVRDDDVGPVVAYLMEHPAQTSPAEEESILVAPGYMTYLAEYFSRGRLDYTRIDSDTALADALQRASERNATTWLLVDARWPDFATIQNDARLQETHVPGETSDRIRLFRLRANP